MKKILNYFFDSTCPQFAQSFSNDKLVLSLGNDSFVDRKEMKLKDLTLTINSVELFTSTTSSKVWQYLPDTIYVKMENNNSSNIGLINNFFPFFTILHLSDLFVDDYITTADVSTGYKTKIYKYCWKNKPPKIDLSTNICMFSFWAVDKTGTGTKTGVNLFIPDSLTTVAGGSSAYFRCINILAYGALYDVNLKSGINISLSIEI